MENKDLKCIPWNPVDIVDKRMLLKFLLNKDGYDIIFTDLANVWHEKLDSRSIHLRAKEINPDIEVSVEKLLSILKQAVEGRGDGTTFSIQIATEDGLALVASFSLAGLPFIWKFVGIPGDSDMLREHLTFPLMMMVCRLSSRETRLFQMLKDKDKELDDLKAQGVRSSRKHLETPRFDEATFYSDLLTSKEFENYTKLGTKCAFDEKGCRIYSEIMLKSVEHLNVQHQQTEVNLGKDSISNENNPSSSPMKSAKSENSPSNTGATVASEDMERQRRNELEKRLAEEESKQATKKKKKMKF